MSSDGTHLEAQAEPLSAFWNAVVSGAAPQPGELDPELADTVLRLHAAHAAPGLPATRQDQIWSELMTAWPARAETWTIPPSQPGAPNGRVATSGVRGAGALPERRGWPVPHFATLALVLFTVLASYVAFSGLHHWPGILGLESRLSLVVSPAALTPEPVTAPIAQLLWQAKGGPDLPFGNPSQPAIDPRGNLWVPDSKHDRFLLFAPDGTFLEAWGRPGSGEGEFRLGDPRDPGFGSGAVAFDAAGNIYVADTGNYRIQKFGPDREFVMAWGSEGSADGQFRRPMSLAVDRHGRVYVSDTGWGKIQVFADDGDWLATWSGLGTPSGITVDGNGNIWVAEGGSGVVKFSAEGERLATWNDYGTREGELFDSVSIAVDAEGRVFVADFSANRIQVFSPGGTFLGTWGERGSGPGQFQAPRGVALDGQGFVYVTESAGKRVQKFRFQPLPLLTPAP